jgi:hypothetical protein
VFLREAAEVELVKLPWQLDGWPKYDAAKRDEDLAALDRLDLFVAHLPLLTANGDLVDFLAPRFQVVAAIYDPAIDLSRFGPILVLERRVPGRRPFDRPPLDRGPGGADENLLFESTAASPAAGSPVVRFEGSAPDGRRETLELSSWRYAKLPPQGLGWIQLAWTSPTGLARDFVVDDRITCPDDTFGWQHNGVPAWDRRPTSTWKPGETVVEGCLVVPAIDPFEVGKPLRPLGEAFRAQGVAPAGLWLRVETADHAALEPEGGLGTSSDGFVRVARFELPLADVPR